MSSLQQIYESHHASKRSQGFSIMEKDRGELLKKNIGVGKKVLDIGCRDGALTKWFAEGNQVLGADIDSVSLDRAKQQLGIDTLFVDLNGDWQELGDQKYDVIVAGEILEHLYYPANVVDKVKSRLNPGGLFLGSVPNAFNLKHRLRYLMGNKQGTPLEDPTHITQFSVAELSGMLSKYFTDFEIIGLGRYKKLANLNPNLFAFDLFFVAKNN
ncbi:MAG: class I SAM-dependent methyltransferase [Patescibacteria group bacterium]